MQTSHLRLALRLQLIGPVIESQHLNRFGHKSRTQQTYLLYPGGDEERMDGNNQY
jgi:hypothetical protein